MINEISSQKPGLIVESNLYPWSFYEIQLLIASIGLKSCLQIGYIPLCHALILRGKVGAKPEDENTEADGDETFDDQNPIGVGY